MMRYNRILLNSNIKGKISITEVAENVPNGKQSDLWYSKIAKSARNLNSVNKIQMLLDKDATITNLDPLIEPAAVKDLEKVSQANSMKKRKYDFLKVIHRPNSITKKEKKNGVNSLNSGDRFLCSAPLSHFTASSILNYKKYQHMQERAKEAFTDIRFVKMKTGKGGDGNISFDPSPTLKGPASGGDGGKGGDIYVQADENLTSLSDIQTIYQTSSGDNGQSNQCDGKSGGNILIKVPVGTHIKLAISPAKIKKVMFENGVDLKDENMVRKALNAYNVKMKCLSHEMMDVEPEYFMLHRDKPKIDDTWKFQSGYSYQDNPQEIFDIEPRFKAIRSEFRAYDFKLSLNEIGADKFPIMGIDLNKPFENPLLLLKGGTAGLGNMHFKINGARNPIFAKRGRQGIEACFVFELKLLADLGLVGLPNAGKSTLLGAISNAKPRVGHWEFTTLVPTLGTVLMPPGSPSFTVSDIPGIIEGASENKGLGLEFLKHIENSSGIVFVLGMDREDPVSDLKVLIRELEIHGISNVERALVVCNKCDLDDKAHDVQQKFHIVKEFVDLQNERIKSLIKSKKDAPEDIESDVFWNAIPISAKNQQNTQLLKRSMSSLVFDKKTNKKRKVVE
ncbi:hypothetical protein FOG51_03918 [Hanseniaspora uvarum]|nr:hypothetical protein FOG51_03918 [Hanseniaspora uvarum]GMM39886.1 putative GTPase [Hanseniaspora uvarum]